MAETTTARERAKAAIADHMRTPDDVLHALDEAGIALVDAEPFMWATEHRNGRWMHYMSRAGAEVGAGNVVNTGRIRAYYAGDPETVSPPETKP